MRASRLLLVLSLATWAACGDNHEVGTDAPSGPPCSDGVDNDSDGTIDFPDDLGCEDEDDDTEDSPARTQCDDNRDNDGDGKIDFPNDPGCPARQADDESDPCPNGAGCPQCGDEQDNDGNGKTDFPEDPGCESAYDSIEFTDDPTACGQGIVIKPLPATGSDMGTLVGSSTGMSFSCPSVTTIPDRPAIAYVFHLTTPKVIVASTDDPMTMIDTVLDLRSSMCNTSGSEVACHDDILPGTGTTANKKSKITFSLKAGTYYLIVGGKTAGDTGQYNLKVEFFPGEGTPCTTAAECGPTLECRIPVGQTTLQCAGPVCFDGIDDDGDGKIDYPLDPGCATPTDSTETDVCATMPTSAQCPQCANGLDDDSDGMTDYPADTSCLAASTIGEACPQSEPVIIATTPQTTGTTVGATNDYRPEPGSFNGHTCSTTSTTTATAPDVTVGFDVPAMDNLALRLSPVGFDSSHTLFGSSCSGTPIDCYDSPTNMVVSNLTAGRYYLIIDGYSSGSGTFTLNISGSIKNGESCESPLAQSGALTCGVGYACIGTAGSRTCAKTQCNDGLDNNGDGRMDYPADPGCVNTSDPVEDTVCPGVNCPVCSDGLDNDGDTLIDYPADTGCITASASDEGCPDLDAVTAITSPTTSDTLIGASDDHNPSCVTTNLPDKVYTLTIPMALQSLVIDTEGSVVDTVLSLMGSTCMEPSIECDDDDGVGTGDSLITRANLSAGRYTIAVDSDSTTLGTFNLNVKGTIAPGGSCEGALVQAGVLVCPPNFGCNGPVGSRTCSAAQCLDGVDNNGDGTADYPNDPSCDSASDNVESNVCPGSSCPACADTIDNDNDGRTDFPNDTACTAASDPSEGCFDSEALGNILMPITTGTLVGATNDRQPACATNSGGGDLVYTLAIPQLSSLTIDTEGSVVDTVIELMNADCSSPAIECDDDDGVGTGDSLIERQFMQAGTYTISVDSDSTTPNTFILNVSGEIAPGASCESPLVSTGALRCSLGFACDGPVGQRTCVVAQCLDGIDNNGDGRSDYPADPGCTSFSDDTESTVCPGSSCPVCSDSVDNDGDGATDYPMDTSCFSASANNEACSQSEPVGVITQRITTGTTANAVNDYSPTCGSTTTHSAPDLAYELNLPALATLTINITGFTPAHSLLNSTCGGTPLGCGTSTITPLSFTNLAAGVYYYIVDGSSTGSGPFTVTIGGTVAPGGSCEGALFEDGAFTCTSGHTCAGALGSRTCVPTQCNDTIDNDGDGKTDLPTDPGCVNINDNTEADDCSPTVGPNCPLCSNAIDDDGDGNTDYPMDVSCNNAANNNESCTTSEGVTLITDMVTNGTTVGATNNSTPTCGTFTTHTAPDLMYQLDVPDLATLNLNLVGFSAVHTLLDSTCQGTPVACSDPELMARTNVPAGTYFVIVDGLTTSSGTFTLTTTGTVSPGGSCEGVLFQKGAFTCTAGYACAGTPGSRTCVVSACNDAIDNDGDGKTDAGDPGCTFSGDDSEVDDCSPTVGVNCPACANLLDDDADMATDFPMDTRCIAPSFFTENFCPFDSDIGGQIVTRTTSGTLVGKTADLPQSCQTSTGNDVSYALRLPVPVRSLVIDTIGSTSPDTIVSLWNIGCTTELGCDDDNDPAGNRSLLVMSNLAAGDYAIQVDAFGTGTTNNAAFVLNVRGIVAVGTACTSELFSTGVLACPTGTSCTAGTCQ
jgi:large repetitive protein